MRRSTKVSRWWLIILGLLALKLLSPSLDLGALMTSVVKAVEALPIVKEGGP